ncbi:MAG: hypothetical protein O9341_06930, partial [Paucibacter sp.]|nr:hypothetical protein [Roseateles sp.]
MPIATLSIDLEAKLANLEAGLDKAARLAEKNAEQTRAAWARAGAGIASVVGALAGFVAVDRMVESFKQAVDGLDKLNDVADATGASIENISGLEDVIRRTGGTIETVETTLIKFNAVLSEAKPDSPMAQALQQIGLKAEELRKMDPAEALLATAKALRGYADDGDKARLVQELFGKSVR